MTEITITVTLTRHQADIVTCALVKDRARLEKKLYGTSLEREEVRDIERAIEQAVDAAVWDQRARMPGETPKS